MTSRILCQRRGLIVLEYLNGMSLAEIIHYEIHEKNLEKDCIAQTILNLDDYKFLEFLNSVMVCALLSFSLQKLHNF